MERNGKETGWDGECEGWECERRLFGVAEGTWRKWGRQVYCQVGTVRGTTREGNVNVAVNKRAVYRTVS